MEKFYDKGAALFLESIIKNAKITASADLYLTSSSAADSEIKKSASIKNADKSDELHHNSSMETVGRQELEAKLEAVEARMDARVARIEGMISNIAQSQAEARREIEHMRAESREDNKSTRTTIIVTAVSAVLAIVGGVAAFNATVLSNMVASFESGKNTAASLAEAAGNLAKVQPATDIKQRSTSSK